MMSNGELWGIGTTKEDFFDETPMLWIVKISHPFSVNDPTGTEIPRTFNVAAAYPNPFNSSTVIPYSVANPGLLRVLLFDSSGRQLWTTSTYISASGRHSFLLNQSRIARDLPNGNYFVNLQFGLKSLTTSVILVK